MASTPTSHRRALALLSAYVAAAAIGLLAHARPSASHDLATAAPATTARPVATTAPADQPAVSVTLPPTTVPPPTVRAAPPTTVPPRPKPVPSTTVAARPSAYDYLACVRNRESRAQYVVVNGSSGAGGAYQFLPATWNATARQAGRPDLVGVHPSQASQRDQDLMAAYLLQWQGPRHWSGPGC